LSAFSQQRRQRLIGIALMCGAVALFACLDTTAKYLNTQMDTLEIAWARYTSAFVLTLIVTNPFTHRGLLSTRSPKLQMTRSILLVLSTILNFLALRWLQLDEALSIIFTFPFIVAIIAGPLLGEWIGWRRWSAIGFGFAGVLLITRPGLGGMHPAAFFSLAATVCYGFYAVITRIVSRVDSNQTSLFYANAIGALVMLPVIPFVWQPPADWMIALMLMMTGAVS
jgi:drug/metabolite transporter (DMT)-like permease